MEKQYKTNGKRGFKALIAGVILATNIGTYCLVNQHYNKQHEKDYVAVVITQSKEEAKPTVELTGSIGEKTFLLHDLENMVSANTEALIKAANDAGEKLSTKLKENLTTSHTEQNKNDYRIGAKVTSTIYHDILGYSRKADITITPRK
jgi:hypothetical protein